MTPDSNSRLDDLYKDLPEPAQAKLKEYGFDSTLADSVLTDAARCLVEDPAEMDKILEGLQPIFRLALKTRLRVFAQAPQVLEVEGDVITPEIREKIVKLLLSLYDLKDIKRFLSYGPDGDMLIARLPDGSFVEDVANYIVSEYAKRSLLSKEEF